MSHGSIVENAHTILIACFLFHQVAMESNPNPKMDVMLLRIKESIVVVVINDEGGRITGKCTMAKSIAMCLKWHAVNRERACLLPQ
jgi:hypothetical protein